MYTTDFNSLVVNVSEKKQNNVFQGSFKNQSSQDFTWIDYWQEGMTETKIYLELRSTP